MAKESLIDQLLTKAEEIIEAAKRPYIKKKINRAFESAMDALDEKVADAQMAVQTLRLELVKKPEQAASLMDKIIENKVLIDRSEKTKLFLQAEKDELFN